MRKQAYMCRLRPCYRLRNKFCIVQRMPVDTRKPKSGSGKCIPVWNEQVKEYREIALFWHGHWKYNNSTRTETRSQIRRSTRACYHTAVKAAKASAIKTQSRVMAEALLENNSRDLWTEIKKVNRKSGTIPTTMDDTLGEASVADVFANKFKSLYSCVSYDQCDMDGLLNDVDSLISNVCCSDGCTKGLDIHTDNASRAMRHMSRGKRDGGVGLSTDNLINAPLHELQVHLALIFTTMLRQAILHGACASSTTQKASQVCHLITDSSNYRGIALNSPLCKAFKLVVLDIHHDVLCSFELPFGLKRCSSITQCTSCIFDTGSDSVLPKRLYQNCYI